MDNVDVKLLRAYVTLMSEGSVSRAADRLGVGQPALSQSLARLRALLGDPLLLRSRGKMVPTDRGREIEQSFRAMLAEYDRVTAPRGRFEPATSRRKFVVTAPEYAEHLLMPRVMARLRAEAPQIEVQVRAPQPDRAAEQLESGEVDLRLAWVLAPPPTMRALPLFQDQIVCLASDRHPEVKGQLTLAQFAALPHVRPLGPGRPTTTRVLDEALDRHGLKLALRYRVQNFLTIPFIVAGSDMLATLPRMLAEPFAAQHRLQLLELPLRVPRIRYAAYWHERSQKDPAHRWLRDIVVGTAKEVVAMQGARRRA